MMESKVLDVLADRVLSLGPKPDTASAYRNFKLTRDADGIAWLLFDRVLTLGPSPATGPYRHLRLTRDADGLAWLLFDREGSSANTLCAEVMEELDQVLTALESERASGLVIRSAKSSGFIAGADVNEFRGANDPAVVEAAIARAQAVIDRLEALRMPSGAVIHGFCLGGGHPQIIPRLTA